MTKYVALILILLFSGCQFIELDSKWKPLKYVKQNPYQPVDIYTTLGNSIYVRNLEDWQKKYPEGSQNRNWLLLHERVHSYRQAKMGLTSFTAKYAYNKEFRWNEERLAEYASLKYLMRIGALKPGEQTEKYLDSRAKFFSGEAYKKMVSYQTARQWFDSVVHKGWEPDKTEPMPPNLNF